MTSHQLLIAAYERLGAPHDVIGAWALPEPDAELLAAYVQQIKPSRILEIGTYVGVSTMLMALNAPEATVVTVDPNLPLALEASAMRVTAGEIGHLTTFDVARMVAQDLKLDSRIRFVEGGFSTGTTFLAFGAGDDQRIDVVGPKLAQSEAPFDLIFIDGLHTADAVESDIRLAATMLADDGVLLLHDCVGAWGTNVRAGALRFLADNPDFRFVHPPFALLYQSVGCIARAGHTVFDADVFRPGEDESPGASTTARRFARNMIDTLRPASVAVLEGSDSALAQALSAEGCAIAGPKEHPAVLASTQLADMGGSAALDAFMAEIAGKDLIGALTVTPPGEAAAAGEQSRPLATLVGAAQRHGLALALIGDLATQPQDFAFSRDTRSRTTDSRSLLAVAIARGDLFSSLPRPLVSLTTANAELVEQDALLRVHYGAAFTSQFHFNDSILVANDQLRKQVGILEAALTGEKEQVASARAEIENQSLANDQLRKQIGNFEAALNDERKQVASVRAEIEKQSLVNDQLRKQVGAFEAALSDEKEQVASARAQIEKIMAANDELREQVSSYSGSLEAEKKRVESIQAETIKYVQANDDLRLQVFDFSSALDAERTNHIKLIEELDKLRNQN